MISQQSNQPFNTTYRKTKYFINSRIKSKEYKSLLTDSDYSFFVITPK